MFHCRTALLVILALAASGESEGKTFRVAGEDELKRAAESAQAGDELILANGAWRDVDLLFHCHGSESGPITLRAETPGRVIISGHSRLRIAGRWLVISGLSFTGAWHERAVVEFRKDSRTPAKMCRMTACSLVNCSPPDPNQESKCVSLYGQQNRMDHCRIVGKTNRGATVVVWLQDTECAHRIDHNFFGPRPELGANGGETMRVGDSETSLINARCVVEANLFEECNGEAEIISNKSCENIYRYNTFVRCAGALTLRHGHRCCVEGNWFIGQGARKTGGVRIIGADHRVTNNYFSDLTGDETRSALSIMNGIANSPLSGYSRVERATIAFNTFVQCKHSLTLGLRDEDVATTIPPTDCVIANNLVVGRRGPLVDIATAMKNTLWQGNFFHGADVGMAEQPGISRIDPRLKRGRAGLMRPGQDSPTVGAAKGRFVDVDEDIDGQPRTDPKDIGCDQQSSFPMLRRPLDQRDVGAAWMRVEAPKNHSAKGKANATGNEVSDS